MELSSLIVPNNKKHFVVVFIGLVLIFKIALITAANEKSQGQEGLYIGEEVGFTDLLFYDDVTREDMEAGKATGKILLFFQRANFEDDFAAYAKSKGAVGVIIATQPTDSIDASTVDIAIAYVDNELGMDILLYIQTTK
ncbi:unnamed protein product [Arabidopsis thaliana]|uniref:(thale cress) hypothetical protein n=1 Tax=Arabidopsis thaliana TaxID=3702 RepID=A0A7G2E0F5_ARATH|nr:unnamed protein product [Arabidopsis thaliana]